MLKSHWGLWVRHSSHLGYLATEPYQAAALRGSLRPSSRLLPLSRASLARVHTGAWKGLGTVETQARLLGNASEFLAWVAAKSLLIRAGS